MVIFCYYHYNSHYYCYYHHYIGDVQVLRNAGLVFCPSHLAERRRQQGQLHANAHPNWVAVKEFKQLETLLISLLYTL